MKDLHANFKKNQKRIQKLLDGMQYNPRPNPLGKYLTPIFWGIVLLALVMWGLGKLGIIQN